MKMKEITVYLSVLTFLQVIFLATVGKLASEILKSSVNAERIFGLATATLALITVIVVIYVAIFNGAKHKK